MAGIPIIPNAETICLAADYIRHRLSLADYDWDECSAPLEPDRVRLVMRNLCVDMETRYIKEIAAMVQELNITRDSMYDTFTELAVIIFEEASSRETHNDKINWGKIVTLWSFSGLLAVHCVENGMEDLVPSIADWLAVFTIDRLRPWIVHHGGWDGLVEFYETRQNAPKWSDWARKFGMVGAGAAVAAGAVVLGRTLSG